MDRNVFMDNEKCPKCDGKLMKKKPVHDKFLKGKEHRIVRLFCPCGYYRDEIVQDDPLDIWS